MDNNVIISEYHVPHGIGLITAPDAEIQKTTTFGDCIAIASNNGTTTLLKAQTQCRPFQFKWLQNFFTGLVTSFCWMKLSSLKLFAGNTSGSIKVFRIGQRIELIHELKAHIDKVLGIEQWDLTEKAPAYLSNASEHGFISIDTHSIKIWKITFSDKKTITENLYITPNPDASFQCLLKIGRDCVWTAMSNDVIKVWTRTSDDLECSKELEKTFCATWLVLLEDNIVVSANQQRLCSWRTSGELLGTYGEQSEEGTRVDVGVWHNRLCTATSENIYLWNLHQCSKVAICAQNVQGLVCWKLETQELLCSFFNNSFVVWESFVTWSSIRVLWIGWKKNTPSECIIASLPKEILMFIIGLLGWPPPKEYEAKKRQPAVLQYPSPKIPRTMDNMVAQQIWN